MTEVEWKKTAQYLWDLLDSIDSLPDAIHPGTSSAYFQNVERRHKLRFNVGLVSPDGQEVAFNPVPENVERP